MKKLVGLLVVSIMMSSVYAAETSTATQPSTTTSSLEGKSSSNSNNGMNADYPSPDKAKSEDSQGGSSGFSDSVRTYWNKFIDVFTGPPSK